jgi:glyoxylase-like metal-dependent hydrolase (beta-lactamase superfamily II)
MVFINCEVPLLIESRKKCCEVFPIIVPDRSLKSVNFYLVKRENSLSLIDAGWNNEECWNALTQVLRINGFSTKDLTEIILTHHHIDHIGLVNRIVSEHPIPVYTSPHSIPRLTRDLDFLEMRIEFYKKLYKEMGCGETAEQRIDYLIKAAIDNKDNTIQADIRAITDKSLFHFEIVEIPGHAPDQIAFLDPKENRVFAGDLLLEHISSNALVEPDYSGKRLPTLSQHIESLRKCMELNVELVYPGHGNLIKNPNELIKKRLDRVEIKGQRILELIKSGITTANDIAVTWYKDTYYNQFGLVMSEIIGHLDYLETQRKIEKQLINGVWQYKVVS